MPTHWASASNEYSKMKHTTSATTAQYFQAATIAVTSAAVKYFQLLMATANTGNAEVKNIRALHTATFDTISAIFSIRIISVSRAKSCSENNLITFFLC